IATYPVSHSWSSHLIGQSLQWSPDNTHIASPIYGGLEVWNAITGSPVISYHDDSSRRYAWSSDGIHIAWESYQMIRVWSIASGDNVISHPYNGHCWAWSPNGTSI